MGLVNHYVSTAPTCLYALLEQRRRKRPTFLLRTLAYWPHKKRRRSAKKEATSSDSTSSTDIKKEIITDRILENVERTYYSHCYVSPQRQLRLSNISIEWLAGLLPEGSNTAICEFSLYEVTFPLKSSAVDLHHLVERRRLRVQINKEQLLPVGDSGLKNQHQQRQRHQQMQKSSQSMDNKENVSSFFQQSCEFGDECFANEQYAKSYTLVLSLYYRKSTRCLDYLHENIDENGIVQNTLRATNSDIKKIEAPQRILPSFTSEAVYTSDLSLTDAEGLLVPSGSHTIQLTVVDDIVSFRGMSFQKSKSLSEPAIAVKFDLQWINTALPLSTLEYIGASPFHLYGARNPPSKGRLISPLDATFISYSKAASPSSGASVLSPSKSFKVKNPSTRKSGQEISVQYCFVEDFWRPKKMKMTRPYANFMCPWCVMQCPNLHALIYHLCCCHDRFQFKVMEAEKNPSQVRIMVALDESYANSDQFIKLSHGLVPIDFFFSKKLLDPLYLSRATDPSNYVPLILSGVTTRMKALGHLPLSAISASSSYPSILGRRGPSEPISDRSSRQFKRVQVGKDSDILDGSSLGSSNDKPSLNSSSPSSSSSSLSNALSRSSSASSLMALPASRGSTKLDQQQQQQQPQGNRTAIKEAVNRRTTTRQPELSHLKERRFYHLQSLQPITFDPDEYDSEDDATMEWLHRLDSICIDEFTDVNEGEKKMMKLWNQHIREYRPGVFGDRFVPKCVESFAITNKDQIRNENLRNNFALHLLTFGERGLISVPNIVACLKIIDST